jgi:hypothetical protein
MKMVAEIEVIHYDALYIVTCLLLVTYTRLCIYVGKTDFGCLILKHKTECKNDFC